LVFKLFNPYICIWQFIDKLSFKNPLKNQKLLQKLETSSTTKINKTYRKLNGSNNVWIIKPAGLSRGRGIELFGSWKDISNQLKNKEFQWVCQKYIENPALIGNRKFDIRQWVLVTDWNPLTIWFYEECYIRFTHNTFSLDNIKDRYAHLTNNSVNKYADGFNADVMFWDNIDLVKFLKEEKGYDFYNCEIKPRMEQIVKYSMMSVQDMIENRKNSSEIYGYDFCLDDDYKIW